MGREVGDLWHRFPTEGNGICHTSMGRDGAGDAHIAQGPVSLGAKGMSLNLSGFFRKLSSDWLERLSYRRWPSWRVSTAVARTASVDSIVYPVGRVCSRCGDLSRSLGVMTGTTSSLCHFCAFGPPTASLNSACGSRRPALLHDGRSSKIQRSLSGCCPGSWD
jgi:hypothetical protein